MFGGWDVVRIPVTGLPHAPGRSCRSAVVAAVLEASSWTLKRPRGKWGTVGLTAGEAQQLLQAALARGDLQLDSDGTPTGTPALKPCANPADTAAGVDGAPARNGTTTPPAEEVPAAPPGTPPNKEAAGKALRLLLVSPLL